MRNNHYKIKNPYTNKIWEKYNIQSRQYYKIISNESWHNKNYNKKIKKLKLTQKQIIEIKVNHISKGIYKRKPWEKYEISQRYYYNVLAKN